MKKLIPILLINLVCNAQPTVNVWRVKPDTICAGDTIRINYKFNKPSQPDATTNYIYIIPGNILIWSGNWSILANKPKEHWSSLSVGDSAYLIKIKSPSNLSVGQYSIQTNGSMSALNKFYVKSCNCTVTANFNYTSNPSGIVSFSSTSIGTTSQSIYYWNYGVNTGYQPYQPVNTYTYLISGTYSVSLMVVNPTCTNTVSKSITVSIQQSTTGVNEYEINQNLIYFDLNGNQIEKRYNEVIIEQVGNRRRKIIISKYE